MLICPSPRFSSSLRPGPGLFVVYNDSLQLLQFQLSQLPAIRALTDALFLGTMSLRVHRKFVAVAAASVMVLLILSIQFGTLDPSRTIEIFTSDNDAPLDPLPCSRLPGADELLVVMRTGATELQEKLPIHLNTILRCAPYHTIYSDMAETFQSNAVLDALEDVDPSIKTTHEDFALYRRLQQSGRPGLQASELSGAVSSPQSASGKPTNPGWKLDKWKFLPMVRKTLQDHPEKPWYLFIETDTFILWESLLAYMAALDQTKPYYIGGQTWIGDVEFAHGGSGFLVSRPALELVVEQYVDNKHEWEAFTDGHWAGDCVLGKAFKDAGISLTGAWPIWQGDDIGNMNYGRTDNSHRLWCHPSVSYHHLSPSAIDDMWKFEQNWTSSQKSSHSTPSFLRHKQVFTEYIMPRTAHQKSDWDNHSDEDQGQVASPDACRLLCKQDSACVQWAMDKEVNGKCMTTSRPNLGEPSPGRTSGWIEKRMRAFYEKEETKEPCKDEGWIMVAQESAIAIPPIALRWRTHILWSVWLCCASYNPFSSPERDATAERYIPPGSPMDPATAIGVASAAITFLDFTVDVCMKFGEIISSTDGATKENAEIELRITVSEELSQDLRNKKIQASGSGLERNISDAVDNSIACSNDLLKLLKRIREARDTKAKRPKILGTITAVYLSTIYHKDIKSLENNARKWQAMVALGLTQAIWEKSIHAYEISEDRFRGLDKQAIAILGALKAGARSGEEVLKQINDFRQHFDGRINDIKGVVQDSGDRLGQNFDVLALRVKEMSEPDLKKTFMESLFFPQYQKREKTIDEPNAKTFDWIFDRDGGATSDLRARWPSFPQWLEDAASSQQYWLSGKAGSGKSTLMAHVVRDERTKRHLQCWSGSKPLHILSFFLFRMWGESQCGLEHLLRSLLYQLAKKVPQMQETLMAQFFTPESHGKAAAWPVNTLKDMLTCALEVAVDCKFLILVDGVDEFEDFVNPHEKRLDASGLVDLLYTLQTPQHVKLCISSRPELHNHITRKHSSFLVSKLAELNRDDIRIFVDAQMQALPGLMYHDRIVREICVRADGIFMWAVFAVRQIEDGCDAGERHSILVQRLDDMGEGLNNAISYMLRRIGKHHREAVAFYLQAMKSWRDSGSMRPMTVALIAASRSEQEPKSYSEFLGLCEKEDRQLQNFTHGLIEVRDSSQFPGQHVLIKSHSALSGVNVQHMVPGSTQCSSWVIVARDGDFRALIRYFQRTVSLVHRSAYDFFFDQEDAQLRDELQSLMNAHNASGVPTEVQIGLSKLLWLEPRVAFFTNPRSSDELQHNLRNHLSSRSKTIIAYIAGASFSQADREALLNNLLYSTRQELLYSWVAKPILEQRQHVPGDLYSSQIVDGQLKLMEEDIFSEVETIGPREAMRSLASLEARFWVACGEHKELEDYFCTHVATKSRQPFGCLVIAHMSFDMTDDNYDGGEVRDIWLKSVQDWNAFLCKRTHLEHPGTSIRRWLVSLVSRHAPTHQEFPRSTRISRYGTNYVQWTSQVPIEDAVTWHLADILWELIRSVWYAYDNREHTNSLRSILEPWETWACSGRDFDQRPSTSSCSCLSTIGNSTNIHAWHRTEIFFSSNYGLAAFAGEPKEPVIVQPRWRLIHLLDDDVNASASALFSHDISPSLELWSTWRMRDVIAYSSHATSLETQQIDSLIEDIRQSTQLDDSQKETFIKYIGTWEVKPSNAPHSSNTEEVSETQGGDIDRD
ncbi:hypothetical protein Q7P37_007333 [Cladosporium fusiforme]